MNKYTTTILYIRDIINDKLIRECIINNINKQIKEARQ